MLRLLRLLAAFACVCAPLHAAAPAATDPLERLHGAGASVWFEHGRLRASGRELLRQLQAAAERGLDPRDYDAATLERAIDALSADPPGADDAAAGRRAAVDRSLSAAALRFLRHLDRGRILPAQAGYAMPVPTSDLDWAAAVAKLAAAPDVAAELDGYEPRFLHYQLLKQALARYRALAARPFAPLPPLPTGRVQVGSRWAGVPVLRERLAALGDLASPLAPVDPEELDAPLGAALARFQARHGLAADGVLGRGTLAALNVPLSHRVDQLVWSMERARWLPDPVGPFILVNIPQYRLFAFSGPTDREEAMTPLNVIVGQSFPEHNTPIFTADLRYVVMRPYWDVPPSIARKELVPALRKDPQYAAKHHFELVRGQGDASPVVAVTAAAIDELARGALRIRQRPGADNALGRIKFMLPNPYNVYLHGTPAQSLFGRARRDFSHGCIRVEDPPALARFVLEAGGAVGWTEERIARELGSGESQPLRVNLARTIQVLIVYATALAAEDGRVLFFEDVYGHDARLAALLAERFSRSRT